MNPSLPGTVKNDDDGAHTEEAPAAVAQAGASEPLWQSVEEAPFGIPVRVRDASGTTDVAIRDPYCSWYNESRSGGIGFTPTGFAPLE